LQRKAYERHGSRASDSPVGPERKYDVGYRIERGVLITEGRQDIRLVSMAPGGVELAVDGIGHRFEVAVYPAQPGYHGLACIDSALGPVSLIPVSRFTDPASLAVAGSLLAPMPGTVARLGVATGDPVLAGQPLLWLEAMKMEHVISAPAAGIVAELPVAVGQQVEVGSVLAVVKPEEHPE
jgi:propionyl-CoA carboxylase alpha chain